MTERDDAKQKLLVKTLTIPVGNPLAYDNRAKTVSEVGEETRKSIYLHLPEVSKTFAMLCNICTARTYARTVLGVKEGDEEKEKYSINYAPIRDRLDNEHILNGNVLSQSYRFSNAHFTGEHKKELLGIGSRQLSIHRTDGTHPIPVMHQGVRLLCENGRYILCLSIFSAEWSKKSGIPSWIAFPLKIKPRDKTMAGQLERTISKEWKLKNASIARNTKGRVGETWLASIVVEYTPSPYKTLNAGTVLGIDLGVNAPATAHIRENDVPLKWAMRIGNGRAMLASRAVIRGEIKRLLRALKAKPVLLQGPARDNAMKRLRTLRKLEQRVLKTAARRIAAQIAELAKRNGAGTWQMERLSKEIKEDQPWLARKWAPGVVVDAVRWQAKQAGSEIVFVDPAHTSRRCSDCGWIDKANRPKGKQGAAFFKCVKCGHEDDADKNAARNISNPRIEDLISKSLKEQTECKVPNGTGGVGTSP